MTNTGNGQKGVVLAESAFQHLVNATGTVEPGETSLHFPPLSAILLFSLFPLGQDSWFDAIAASGNTGNNVSFS